MYQSDYQKACLNPVRRRPLQGKQSVSSVSGASTLSVLFAAVALLVVVTALWEPRLQHGIQLPYPSTLVSRAACTSLNPIPHQYPKSSKRLGTPSFPSTQRRLQPKLIVRGNIQESDSIENVGEAFSDREAPSASTKVMGEDAEQKSESQRKDTSTSEAQQKTNGAANSGDRDGMDDTSKGKVIMSVEVVRSIKEIPKHEWDALLHKDDSPFLEYDWLSCLEESGTVGGPDSGWYPFHIAIRETHPNVSEAEIPTESGRQGRLLGAVPLYLKTNSMGEYIFDQSWADAAYLQLGIEYYPKLVSAIPFTPATGKRFLTHPEADRGTLVRTAASVLQQLVHGNNFSSVHVLFHEQDEAAAIEHSGYLTRKTVQNHFENRNPLTGNKFSSFQEYVSTLKPNRRKALRRERKKIYQDEGIQIKMYEGDEVTREVVETAYDLYENTNDKFWFQKQYLNKKFFLRIHDTPFRRHLAIVLAKRGNKTIGGTFNVQKGDTIYGRYWGCFEDVPFLYFEACYYRLIEHVISKKMLRMEAGAGSSGGGKLLRGFDASITTSSHYIADRNLRYAVGTFLASEGDAIEMQKDALNQEFGAFKVGNNNISAPNPTP